MHIEVETIAKGKRYMLHCRGHVLAVSAEDCLEILEILYLKRDEFAGRDDGLEQHLGHTQRDLTSNACTHLRLPGKQRGHTPCTRDHKASTRK